MVNPGPETLFAIHEEIHSPDAVRTVLSPNPIEPTADFSADFEEDMPEPEVPTGRSRNIAELAKARALFANDEDLSDLSTEEPTDRTETMRALLESRGLEPTDLVDNLGRPLGMESLLKIAQISGIWPLLSEEQRRLFMESDGFLRDGKAYISKRIRTEAPTQRRTLVQLANGTRVAL